VAARRHTAFPGWHLLARTIRADHGCTVACLANFRRSGITIQRSRPRTRLRAPPPHGAVGRPQLVGVNVAIRACRERASSAAFDHVPIRINHGPELPDPYQPRPELPSMVMQDEPLAEPLTLIIREDTGDT